MKLYVKGTYHNGPAGLHFDGAGVVEIDEDKAAFLLRDAPENFADVVEDKATEDAKPPAPTTETGEDGHEEVEAKAFDAAPVDKAVKEPKKKK